jgi:hypothetical protein
MSSEKTSSIESLIDAEGDPSVVKQLDSDELIEMEKRVEDDIVDLTATDFARKEKQDRRLAYIAEQGIIYFGKEGEKPKKFDERKKKRVSKIIEVGKYKTIDDAPEYIINSINRKDKRTMVEEMIKDFKVNEYDKMFLKKYALKALEVYNKQINMETAVNLAQFKLNIVLYDCEYGASIKETEDFNSMLKKVDDKFYIK